ncbi:hypothetical protein [Pedobacter sp. MW01-1-1]|uniref:hypothetical protein n=1 Tax=Pedobacter sp. MW01-1-1 TaxID=3383027 RepID=UPI003FF0D045
MRNIKYLFILLFFISCRNRKYIIIPTVKGKIYSKVDNNPIKGAVFFVSKFAVNSIIDSVRTDKNGFFVYDGFFVHGHSSLQSMSPMVQQVFFIKKNNIYRYIDVKKYYNKDDYYKKDTIDLGIIYFEDLKSIEKDSIRE